MVIENSRPNFTDTAKLYGNKKYPAILQMLDGKIRVDEYMIQIHEKSIATAFKCYKNESVEKAIPPYLAKEDALEAYCWNKPYELVIRFVVKEGVLER